MTSQFTRLAVLAACALGASGVVAAPAFAAAPPPPTIAPATAVTPESAVLNGTISTGTPTSYTFEYDTVTDWNAGGDNASFAGPFFVDASSGPQAVSAPIGCYPMLTCGLDGTPLAPNTTYVFQLQAQPGVTGKYYYTTALSSSLGYFKTDKLGKISLVSTVLPVKHGVASVGLKCSSKYPCSGSLKLTARIKHKAVTCGSAKFALKANKHGTFAVKLASSCTKALRKTGKLTASIAVVATTDQTGVHKKVKLSSTKGSKKHKKKK